MNQLFKTVFILLVLLDYSFAKQIHDMLGREVTIPSKVEKAFCASPPMMALLYTLAPKKMIGVNYSFLGVEKQFMLPYVQNLPILGGFFGGGNQANIEKIVALKPDIVFAWDITHNTAKQFESVFNSFNIPVVYIRQNTLYETLDAIQLMAEGLHVQQRGEELISYAKERLGTVQNSVRALGDIKRKRVFFAQGEDGLFTECSNDRQSEVITFAGGVNVHECPENKKANYKREKISLEKLYSYDPDIILVREKNFFESLAKNELWHNLKAYKNKQIFLVPSSPFAWLSRPPSFMRFLGVQWLHHILYPKHFDFDIQKETTLFYKKFLHVQLTKNQVEQLLKGEIK